VLRLLNRSQRSAELFLALAVAAFREQGPSEPMQRARQAYGRMAFLTEAYVRYGSLHAFPSDAALNVDLEGRFAELSNLQETAARALAELI
jgi:hypothetical protein